MPSLSRRQLLAAALAAGVVPVSVGGAAGPARRRLVLVWARGGWDVTFAFDPKLGVGLIEGPEFSSDPGDPDDVEEVRSFGDLKVVVNDQRRPSVSAFFDRRRDQTAIVNGIWVGSIAHDPCRLRVLTGTTRPDAADVVTRVGAAWGADLPLGSVDMAGVGFTGPLAATAGTLGASSQLKTLLDPAAAFLGPGRRPLYPQVVPSAGDDARTLEALRARHAAVAARFGEPGAVDPRLRDWLEASDRASRLSAQAAELAGSLTLGTTPSLALGTALATDLLAADLCSAVLIDSGRGWDTHSNNAQQHGHFEALFAGLIALADALDAKGLAGSTTVAVLSEMTRTPRHNLEGGKDHWQHTSAMLFGAGVRPGRYGATDDLLESLPMDLRTGEPTPSGRLCTYENLAAGLLATLDVDPGDALPGVAPFLGAKAG